MSTLSQRLLEQLACPRCKGALEPAGGERLRCTSCGLRYPVRDGIPFLLPEEADTGRDGG